GLDWAYVPLPVEPQELESALRGLVALGFVGANVTIPHKTAAAAFCDELDLVSESAGSVNTILVREGRLLGSSTDGEAVVSAVEPGGADVLMLGSGGAAQAVATALAEAGVRSLSVAGVDEEQSGALVARLHTLFPRLRSAAVSWPPSPEGASLIVNATPLREEPPVEVAAHQQLVDMPYFADGSETALVRAARAAGCRIVVDGLEVLMRQGAAAFERWTGIEAPLEVMRAALRSSQ
ncbi:MAG: shikimate dehydrogenase family protein, partial [Gaiellaceae bacterium]